MNKDKWSEISENTIFENAWIKVSEFNVLDPNGNKGIYSKVHYKKTTVGIIPLFEDYKTILVGQYRFPTQSYSWEIPMGGAELQELPLEAAKRELMEETGIIAESCFELLNLETSNSVTDEKAIIYYCKVVSIGKKSPERSELLKHKILDFSEVVKMVINGEITDAISVASILKMHLIINETNKPKL